MNLFCLITLDLSQLPAEGFSGKPRLSTKKKKKKKQQKETLSADRGLFCFKRSTKKQAPFQLRWSRDIWPSFAS